MKILSYAFEDNQSIPSKYTCDGENINPELTFSEIPEGTKSLVLIVDDPDAPIGIFTHWLLWNISPETSGIAEGEIPEGATQGVNDFGGIIYGGPCPPTGTHRYQFKLYALNISLDIQQGSKVKDVKEAMQDHILGQATLVGLYKRS